MVTLFGGIQLPLPKRLNKEVFEIPEDWKRTQITREREALWTEAYNYCLVFIHNAFDLPLHSMVTAIAKNLPKSQDAEAIALRFLGEMELAGYISFITKPQDDVDKMEREVIPTKKLLKLKITDIAKDTKAIVYPYVINEDIVSEAFEVRHGSNSNRNKGKVAVVKDIAAQSFTINGYVLDLIAKFPPETESLSEKLALIRTIASAKKLSGKTFRFPYFLDSRGRIYDATTCGISPQGADHEKALVQPAFLQKLTEDGFNALVEAAHGYSEIEWDVPTMVHHATMVHITKAEWMEADKPYSYMACAELIRRYHENNNELLPAFIPLDGRCSGLQHWSALVRSNSITKHIGMDTIEADRDIYERVADDWKDTLPDKYKHLATRKASKIPTMTWAYNATRMTSMDHLKNLYGQKSKWDYDKKDWVVVKKGLEPTVTARLGCDLYDGLNNTLNDLTSAVEWVSESARTIAKTGKHQISWITPDGFYCMQTKVKPTEVTKKVTLSNGDLFKVKLQDFSGRNTWVAKHVSAIAPNIIHSLDATHLRMVAKRLKELDDPMVFIHDSFATHCNFRETLYDIIIDTFIELYSRDYLSELKVYWENRYDVKLSDTPEMGDFLPESLRDLTLFFK